MSRVQLANVTKRFGTRSKSVLAVDNLSLKVEAGEFVTIVGPSGCGKTTTLRMIAGLETVTGGAIGIDGNDVTEDRPQDRELSMVFQNYAIFPHMSVRENIGYAGKIQGRSPQELERLVAEAARMVDISELLDRKPKELSGGQRQRVALARAIAGEPRLVLMDEPLSNLDAQLRDATRAELKRLHERLGATIIYVTHDQTEAMTLSSRLAVMRDGRLQQFASPRQIYDAPANLFVAEFIGSPPINLANGVITDTSGHLHADVFEGRVPLNREGWTDLVDGRRVTCGIRPSDLHLLPSDDRSFTIGEVVLVEELGERQLVHVDVDGRNITTLARSGATAPGHRVHLGLSHQSRIHLFDPETGASMSNAVSRLNGAAA